MKRLVSTITCGLIVLLSGCSGLSDSDMVGTYKDNGPHSTSILVLKPNGTFSQVLSVKGGKKYTAVGKWLFDTAENELQLDTGLSYDDLENPGHPRVNRIGGSYSVEKLIPEGQPQIVINPDQGIAFNKVNQDR